MLIIKANLPIGAKGSVSYISAWTALLAHTGELSERELQKSLFTHLYENLNILDSKTNSLIQLNGTLVASYVFTLSFTAMRMPKAETPAFVMGLCYAVAAILLCMRVIWVHWSSRADLRDPAAHMLALIRIRSQRTIEFRRAWTFTLISMLTLVVIILNEFVINVVKDFTNIVLLFSTVHLFMIYVYDDLNLLLVHRNVALRATRLAKAFRAGRMRWRVLSRAVSFRPRHPATSNAEERAPSSLDK